MKHTKKRTKMIITSLALLLVTTSLPMQVLQAKNAKFTATTKNTTKIPVEKVEYDLDDSDESIEIDFATNVKYKSSAKVTVKDTTGKTYPATIIDYDKDDCSIHVSNLKSNKTYTVTLTGIKKSSASKYGSLSIKFTIPKASSKLVKEVEYDNDDREITFDFTGNVVYRSPKITITNTSGTKTYASTIIEKENDECTVSVRGLKNGSKYKYTITGIRLSSASKSSTVSGTFIAID